MNKRVLVSIFTAATMGGAMALATAFMAGQGQQGAAAKKASGPTAPIPRMPDGKPDLTGVWDVDGIEDITKALAPGNQIVFTPYGAQRFKTVDHALDPNARCLPWGPTRMICCTRHAIGFVQHPTQTLILTESQQTFRIVYTDGRSYPKDLYDSEGKLDRQVGGWMGFSIGKWDGDTLVVETKGIDDRTWIDGHGGHEHSDKMILRERFTITDGNTIQYIATIEDPVFFQKPWSFVKAIRRMVGDRIMSHSCVENEKDLQHMKPGVVVGGGQP